MSERIIKVYLNRIKIIISSLTLSYLLSGCASELNQPNQTSLISKNPQEITPSKEQGDINYNYPRPLPKLIFIKEEEEDPRLGDQALHRGWDINGDQRVDLLEVLSRSGERNVVVYDFDFDGEVDLIKDLRQGEGKDSSRFQKDVRKDTHFEDR